MNESNVEKKIVESSPPATRQENATDSSAHVSDQDRRVRWFFTDRTAQHGSRKGKGCIELQRLNSSESVLNGDQDCGDQDDGNRLLVSTYSPSTSILDEQNRPKMMRDFGLNRYRQSIVMELLAVCFLLLLTIVVSFSASGYHRYNRSSSVDSTTDGESSYILSSDEFSGNVSVVAQPLMSSSFEPEVIDQHSFYSSASYNHFAVENQTNPDNLPSTQFESTLFQHASPYLRRIMLKNSSATCNDGTNAGYYLRLSKIRSKKWIVFLEGGWFCYSTYTCHLRWLQMRNLMSSAHWSELRSGKKSN